MGNQSAAAWTGGQPRRRQRRVVVTLVAIVLASSLAASCSSSKESVSQPRAAQTRGTSAEVTSLLTGIPQRGSALGNPTAALTLQYFADLQCPFCREFML